MQNIINLGNRKTAIMILEFFSLKKMSVDIKIINTHIKELNKILKRKIFKKDSLFINAESLWEIMQPIGNKGKHNYHGLSPEKIYDALSTIRFSKDIIVSYDDRYLILTLATVFKEVNIAVIVTPKGNVKSSHQKEINRIITIYPFSKIKK